MTQSASAGIFTGARNLIRADLQTKSNSVEGRSPLPEVAANYLAFVELINQAVVAR